MILQNYIFYRRKFHENRYLRFKYPLMRPLLALILFMFFIEGYSQKVIFLEKTGHHRWYKYEKGDNIRFIIRKVGFKMKGDIQEIDDSSVIVSGIGKIQIAEIETVIRAYKSRKANGIKLIVAGATLAGITCVNNLAHHKPMLDPLYLTISGAIIAGGVIWNQLSERKYRIGEKWKLKVLDYDHSP